MGLRRLVICLMLSAGGVTGGEANAETPKEAAARHRRVSERRENLHLICHRGALEYAHENTLEAYRATFELGGDGNEIDLRMTKDGVLVCFHDDMIDHLLEGYGDVSDYRWEDLQRIPFRFPGRFGRHCRIPTLRETLELHRDHAGLVFLDIKRPGLNGAIAGLLDEYDMWDHVVLAPADFQDPRLKRTASRAGMYLDRTEVDAGAIAEVLKLSGERILLESPQLVARALGRPVGPLSRQPVHAAAAIWATDPIGVIDARSVEELLRVLNDSEDWNRVAPEGDEEKASAERILARARAADEVGRRGNEIPEAMREEISKVLERRVRERSLHRDWRYCGLDGCAALRVLIAWKDPAAVPLARFCLWRDDPEIEAAMNPMWKNPRAWTDFRTKIPVFKLLESLPGKETEKICRDYLALSDEEATRIGIPQFEEAAKCLLAISPGEATIRELEGHRLSAVRGRAKLFAMAQAWE
jgi:hypothetical protein